MKLQLFKLANGAFQTVVFDETKMIPDPQFVRVLEWNPEPPLVPQQQGESAADFTKRQNDHTTAVAARQASIETEAQRLYENEFAPKAAAQLVEEKIL